MEKEMREESSDIDDFDDDFDSYSYSDSQSNQPDTSWRDTCEDGYEYGLDPQDYDEEEEYLDALNEAKYGQRDFCDDEGYEYDIDPEDYETEDEYNAAVREAKYGWRDTCDDGSDYGINPEDYETEDEYLEALAEADEIFQYNRRRLYKYNTYQGSYSIVIKYEIPYLIIAICDK